MTRENETQALMRLASGCGEWCSRFIVLLPAMHAGICVKKSVSSGAFCVASVSSQDLPNTSISSSLQCFYRSYNVQMIHPGAFYLILRFLL